MTTYDERAIESDVTAKNLTAPRVTPEHVDATIAGEAYYVFPGTTVTVCCLTLANGFHVLGHSAAAAPENFDQEIGQKIARAEARDNIWMLEGYLLREELHRRS